MATAAGPTGRHSMFTLCAKIMQIIKINTRVGYKFDMKVSVRRDIYINLYMSVVAETLSLSPSTPVRFYVSILVSI